MGNDPLCNVVKPAVIAGVATPVLSNRTSESESPHCEAAWASPTVPMFASMQLCWAAVNETRVSPPLVRVGNTSSRPRLYGNPPAALLCGAQ